MDALREDDGPRGEAVDDGGEVGELGVEGEVGGAAGVAGAAHVVADDLVAGKVRDVALLGIEVVEDLGREFESGPGEEGEGNERRALAMAPEGQEEAIRCRNV